MLKRRVVLAVALVLLPAAALASCEVKEYAQYKDELQAHGRDNMVARYCRLKAEEIRLLDLSFEEIKKARYNTLDQAFKNRDFFFNSAQVCQVEASKLLGLLRLSDKDFSPRCG